MISNLQIAPLGGVRQWRLSWTTDLVGSTARVYLDGLLLLTTTEQTTVVSSTGSDSPVFEVRDEDEPGDPDIGHPATVTLAWYEPATAGTTHYRVERFDDVTWTPIATILDTGIGYFRWESSALEDGISTKFRVVPVGENGNDGTPIEFNVFVVTTPPPPVYTATFDPATNSVKFTIA